MAYKLVYNKYYHENYLSFKIIIKEHSEQTINLC